MIPTTLNVKAKTLLGTAFKAALISAPVLFAVAPSQAAPLSVTWNSFAGPFASSNWSMNTAQGGSIAGWGTSELRLGRPVNGGSTPSLTYTINPAVFEQYKPAGTKFAYATLSYDWNWSTNSLGASVPSYNFSTVETLEGVATTYRFSPSTGTAKTASGSQSIASLLADDSFGFFHRKTGSTGGTGTAATGTISNFSFTAYYQEVPGPLPVAGAAAAFAWSRRLRRRLKTAQATV